MSEPDGALLKMSVDRDALVQWLDAAPPSPRRWGDWSEIRGSWYLGGEARPLRDMPSELARVVAEVGASLAGKTNRAMLLDMFRPDDPYGEESAATRHFSYDPASREFTAGAVIFAEGLENLIMFLTVARGAADALGPRDSGVAALHTWAFDEVTQAAVRLMPGGVSRFLPEEEEQDAVAQFAPVADRILAGRQSGDRLDTGRPEPVDQLDALRAGPTTGT